MDRLPRGRHGLSPEFVARNQRERLIAGLIQALYEVGYQKTTVSSIGRRAAVSKSDFYKHFESKDECFYAAYDSAIARIREKGQCLRRVLRLGDGADPRAGPGRLPSQRRRSLAAPRARRPLLAARRPRR